MQQKKSRAQLSSEFLYIIAIVMVISLVVAALVSIVFPQDMEARINESKIYWSSTAQPLKITDWDLKVVKQTDPVSVVQYNLTMVLFNPSSELMTVQMLNISPGNYSNVYYTDGTWAGQYDNLAIPAYPHQSTKLVVERWELNDTAAPPITYELGVGMKYFTNLASSEQIGRIPLMGKLGYGTGEAGSLGYCKKADFTCPAGENGTGACCVSGTYCFYGMCKETCGPGGSEFICGGSCCHIDHNCDQSYCVVACPQERHRNCVNQIGKWCCKQSQSCGVDIAQCED